MAEQRCPDCGNDPADDSLHREDCRRILPSRHPLEPMQFGPPFPPWPGEVWIVGRDGIARGGDGRG